MVVGENLGPSGSRRDVKLGLVEDFAARRFDGVRRSCEDLANALRVEVELPGDGSPVLRLDSCERVGPTFADGADGLMRIPPTVKRKRWR